MRRLTLPLLLLVSVAGVFVAYGVWPRGDPAPVPSRPAGPRIVWSFEARVPGGVVAAPTVTDTGVYVTTVHFRGLRRSGAVFALDPITGRERWSFDHDGRMLPTASGPVFHDGRIYCGEGMHADFVCQFYALDAITGTAQWQHETTGHIESTPTLAGGIVYLTAGDDGVYALDAATGTPKWHFAADLHVDSSPCVAGDRVFVGSGPSRRFRSTQVVSLDAATGRPVWRVPTDLPAWGAPTVHTGRVFVGLGNGRLTEGAKPPETPAGAVLCLDSTDGHAIWRFDTRDAVFQKPTVLGDRVYVGSRDGNLYAIRATDGTEAYRVPMDHPVIAPPTADDDKLYVVSMAGLLKCLAAADGHEVWTFDLRQHTRADVLTLGAVRAAGGRVYVGAEVTTGAGPVASVYCLEP